tara:strand:+ start:35319 stop:35783 length:465 start_codon:yes stop_codon:yes gene_type:complete
MNDKISSTKNHSIDSDELRDADKQAAQFERVRIAQKSEKSEDYVEMIDSLINATGEARVTDLANRFGVSNATVNKMIKRLQNDGLVKSRPYRSIFLTKQGISLANISRERHNIVLKFLLSIGVSEHNAELDAEGIEHYVSSETLSAFKKFIGKK